MQIATSTAVTSYTAVPTTQYELAIDAPVAALVSQHEQVGLALGRDYALFGQTPPIQHLYAQSPLQRGWMQTRQRLLKPHASHSHTALWLALRTHAWARGRQFEEVQLTPNYLQQIDTDYCPITREPLSDTCRSIDRVRDDAGYAAGNLAVMSRTANRAKDQRDYPALQGVAMSCQRGPITHMGGLNAEEWQRLAVLASFVTELPHAQAAAIPMTVLPPNRLKLFNPIQALQALVTRQLAKPGWSARLARLEALLPDDAVRADFNRFVLALAPRVLCIAELQTPAQIKWALEDAWSQPLVQKRWLRLALQLSPDQARSLVERAAAKKLSVVQVQTHDQALATEGWALPQRGYLAAA